MRPSLWSVCYCSGMHILQSGDEVAKNPELCSSNSGSTASLWSIGFDKWGTDAALPGVSLAHSWLKKSTVLNIVSQFLVNSQDDHARYRMCAPIRRNRSRVDFTTSGM